MAVLALAAAAPSAARADEPVTQRLSTDRYAAFPLAEHHDKHHVRAGLEVGGILAVGLVDYLLNTAARGGTLKEGDVRWDLRYDWPAFRQKLTGLGVGLDSNKMPTNYVSHPFAGTLYYSVARTNHLSFAESFLFAAVGSSTWEYFGEIREITSINDLVVTPVAGAAIGEATLELAGFFARGKKTFSNDALSLLFSPTKAINEATDDAHTLRSTDTDALGFTRDVWHRFVATAGAGVTIQQDAGRGHPRGTYPDLRFGIDTALANLPGYRGAGSEAHLYDDGNISNLSFDFALSRGRLVDALFAARVVPVGYYLREASLDEAGRPRGSGTLVGLRIGFEYAMHDWDRDRSRPVDVISMVSPLGVAAEQIWSGGDWQLCAGADLYGAIAGVSPYGVGDYRAALDPGLRGTPASVRDQGYYHAFTVTAAPSLGATWRWLDLGARARFDSFRAITGVDENEPLVGKGIRITDTRASLEATLSIRPPGTPISLSWSVRSRSRRGEMGSVAAERDETSLHGSVGVVF